MRFGKDHLNCLKTAKEELVSEFVLLTPRPDHINTYRDKNKHVITENNATQA